MKYYYNKSYSSFVNSSLHLILCGDGVNTCKIKLTKTRFLVMQLLTSHQLNGYQENCGNYRDRGSRRLEPVLLVRRILLIECYSRYGGLVLENKGLRAV